MARILLLIAGNLSMAPRPQKESLALSEAGHEVLILGNALSADKVEQDKVLSQQLNVNVCYASYLDCRGMLSLSSIRQRLARRVSGATNQRFGRQSIGQVGYGIANQKAFAYRYQADLTIAHWEGGLDVVNSLPNRQRIGVDFEDWFSRDLLDEHKATRPIGKISKLEAQVLNRAQYRISASGAMSEALEKEYDCAKIDPIHNVSCIEVQNNKQFFSSGEPRAIQVVWYSQTIGPGRRLEEIPKVLAELGIPFKLTLIGRIYSEEWMNEFIALFEKGKAPAILDPVPKHELVPLLSKFDVGIAFEDSKILSRDLTVTNKIFEYSAANLLILATKTRGQIAVSKELKNVFFIEDLRTQKEQLSLFQDKIKFDRARSNFVGSKSSLTWSSTKKRIQYLTDQALA